MPQPKNDFAFLRKWEKERKENKWRFAFRIGILRYTLPVIAIVTIYDFINGIKDVDLYLKIRIWYGIPIYLICGLLGGLLMWYNNEKRYKSLKGLE
mgnify:CR=1 FL=1